MKNRLPLLFVVLSASVNGWAGPVHVESGLKKGQGITATIGQDCFVITAGHVVREQPADLKITNGHGIRAEGDISKVYGEDIALIRIPIEMRSMCEKPNWPLRGAAAISLDSPALLRRVDETGVETRLEVRIGPHDDRALEVIPADGKPLSRTWSGAVVWSAGEPAGIITDNVNRDGQSRTIGYRREFLNALLSTFVRQSLTPELVAAVRGNNADLARPLLEAGADPLSPVGDGIHNSATLAADLGRSNIIELFWRAHVDLSAKDSSGCAPLGWAIRSRRDSVALVLAKAGVDGAQLCPNVDGPAELGVAARDRRPDMVRALTIAGYSLSESMRADLLERGALEVVLALIEEGSYRDLTPDYFRRAKGRAEVLAALLGRRIITSEFRELCDELILSIKESDSITLASLLKGGIKCSSRLAAGRVIAEDRQRSNLENLDSTLDDVSPVHLSPLVSLENEKSSLSSSRVDNCRVDIKEKSGGVLIYRIDLRNVAVEDSSSLIAIEGAPDAWARHISVVSKTEGAIATREAEVRELQSLDIDARSKSDASDLARAFRNVIAGCKVTGLLGLQ